MSLVRTLAVDAPLPSLICNNSKKIDLGTRLAIYSYAACSAALGLITHLFEQGQLGKAYFTQTAPYHQGTRLTAMELVKIGAPCAMLCDNMVGSLFQNQPIHAVGMQSFRPF